MTRRRQRHLRVLLLLHADTVPPVDFDREQASDKDFLWYKCASDVIGGLDALGHEVVKLGVEDEIAPIRQAVEEQQPHIVFNLLEGFRGLPYLDQNVVAYLELLRMRYSGCNPRGLVLARDKALSKKILAYHRISTPRFAVFALGRRFRMPPRLNFPLIVKSASHDASAGIAQASIVNNEQRLAERVAFIHGSLRCDALVEEFISGREIYVSVIGNHVLRTLPIWELFLDELPDNTERIATAKVKWDPEYQERHNITIERARGLPPEFEARVAKTSKRIYRLLGLSGYGRIDFRMNENGELYFLEANPNPDISADEEFACSAALEGIDYESLLQKVINLGLRR